MIKSIAIKNYRNLQDLGLSSLGRLNLITGKNNTGKTTLLEAIALYASDADLNFLLEFINKRGGRLSLQKSISDKNISFNIQLFRSIFFRKIIDYDSQIYIICSDENDKTNTISFGFVKYIEEFIVENIRQVDRHRGSYKKKLEKSENFESFDIGFEINNYNSSNIIALANDINEYVVDKNKIYSPKLRIKVQIVGTPEHGKSSAELWDNIVFKREDDVINALKIIEPRVEGLRFVQSKSVPNERDIIIKLEGEDEPMPLQSMGDGMNRILNIILALVNCDNGYLLIDEFENGLHYTVQTKLMEVILFLAKEINAQVFMTTHSNDTIAAFEQTLMASENKEDGKLIRLDNKDGIIREVEFSPDELEIALRQHIEIR